MLLFRYTSSRFPKQLRFGFTGRRTTSLFNYNYYTIFTQLKQAKNPLFIKVHGTFSQKFFNPKTTNCVFFGISRFGLAEI